MVIIILTNQLTLTLAILILQSNVLTDSYFPSYPNYSFKSFNPPLRPRRSFITLTRPMRSFGEGREGADKGGCDQRLPVAGVWRRRVHERERKEWRERGVSRAFTRAYRAMRDGASVLRRDLWRGRAGPRHRSLPRWQPGRAAMHGMVE